MECGEQLSPTDNSRESMEEINMFYREKLETWDKAHKMELGDKHAETAFVSELMAQDRLLNSYFRLVISGPLEISKPRKLNHE